MSRYAREAYGYSSHKRRPKPLSEEFIMWATDAYKSGTLHWEDFNKEQKEAIDDELWLRKRERRKATEKKEQEIKILEIVAQHREAERRRLAQGIEAQAKALRNVQADLDEFRLSQKSRSAAKPSTPAPMLPKSEPILTSLATTPKTPATIVPKCLVPRAHIRPASLTSWSTLVVPAPPVSDALVLSVDFKGSDAPAPTPRSPASLSIAPMPLLPTISKHDDPFKKRRKTTCAKANPRGEPKGGKKAKPYNLSRRHLLRILRHHWDTTRKDLLEYYADSRTNLFQGGEDDVIPDTPRQRRRPSPPVSTIIKASIPLAPIFRLQRRETFGLL